MKVEELEIELEKLEDDRDELKFDITSCQKQIRICKSHLESMVKVTSKILEHIVTKCQIQIHDGRSRSHNLSQISASDFGAS